MPIIPDFSLPTSADPNALDLAPTAAPNSKSVFFLSFHASPDPTTGKPWCPDVAAALPYLNEVFSAPQSPTVAYVNVGQRDEWKDPSNIYRTQWKLSCIPTLIRFERVDGNVQEVGRLVEGEIVDRAKLEKFVSC
ncbi:hypothetical protein BJX61DRAFT_251323 [Aspergillus egyptiacus]|nr:hypothetical protein BJX61DRAFT_251323 [Aspergillus egyptiacus]